MSKKADGRTPMDILRQENSLLQDEVYELKKEVAKLKDDIAIRDKGIVRECSRTMEAQEDARKWFNEAFRLKKKEEENSTLKTVTKKLALRMNERGRQVLAMRKEQDRLEQDALEMRRVYAMLGQNALELQEENSTLRDWLTDVGIKLAQSVAREAEIVEMYNKLRGTMETDKSRVEKVLCRSLGYYKYRLSTTPEKDRDDAQVRVQLAAAMHTLATLARECKIPLPDGYSLQEVVYIVDTETRNLHRFR